MRTIKQLAKMPAKAQSHHHDRLNELSAMIESSDASLPSKQNALLLIETFKFILLNQELIIRKFAEDDSVYKNEYDKTHGLLRDHNGTSFHLNSYSSADEAISSLLKMLENLIGAYEQAQTLNALTVFIEKFEYDHMVGCLEARMSRPLIYIATLTSTGIEKIDDVMQKILASTPENEDFVSYITALKKNIFSYIATPVLVANEASPRKLTWDLVKDQVMMFLLVDKGSTDHFLLNQLFSPLEIYFDYLKNFAVEIKFEKSSTIQHCFYQKNGAEEFMSYLKKLSFFLNESAIQRAQIVRNNGRHTILLTHNQIDRIAKNSHIASTLLLQWYKGETHSFPELFSSNAERAACGALSEPYYAKTVTGFKKRSAWQEVVNTITLRDRADKHILRKKRKNFEKPFRVRLNPYTNEFETHDLRDKTQSLHRQEKERRKSTGEIPLPTHQSFTYYDPTDENFSVRYFSPENLSDQQKEEIIGIRVKKESSFLNRLISNDRGTVNIFYGFETEEEANNFKKKLAITKHWATTHEQLKKLQKEGDYNEAMLRANWCCDGSSQIFIYPPHDSLSGKYLAILYKMDLEQHLKNHSEIYKNAPVAWHEGYQVPLAFWDEKKPVFYSIAEQEMDLAKECTDQRTVFLKAFILFLQKKPIPENLYQIMKEKELMLSVLSIDKFDSLESLDFIAISKQVFFDHLYRKLVIDPVTVGLAQLFELTSANTGVKVIVSATKHLIKENNFHVLQKILLREYVIGKNSVLTLAIACQHNMLTAVEALINAALFLKKKNQTDTSLKTMLLNVSVIEFIQGHEKKDEKIVDALLKAVAELRKMNPHDKELENTVSNKVLTTNESTAITISRKERVTVTREADHLTPLLSQKQTLVVAQKKEKINSRFFEDILPELFLEKIADYCKPTDLYNFRLVSKKWCANIFMNVLDMEYQLPFTSSFTLKKFLKSNRSAFPKMNEIQLKEKFLIDSGSGFLDSDPKLFDEKTLEPFLEWLMKKNTAIPIKYRVLALSLAMLTLTSTFIYSLIYIYNLLPKQLTLLLGNSCCADSCIFDSCEQISCQTVFTDQAATEQWLSNREDPQSYNWSVSTCRQYLPMCMTINRIGFYARMIDGDEAAGLSIDCDGFTAKVLSYIGFSLLTILMFGGMLFYACPYIASFLSEKADLKNYNALGDFFKNRIAATKERSNIQVITDEYSLN